MLVLLASCLAGARLLCQSLQVPCLNFLISNKPLKNRYLHCSLYINNCRLRLCTLARAGQTARHGRPRQTQTTADPDRQTQTTADRRQTAGRQQAPAGSRQTAGTADSKHQAGAPRQGADSKHGRVAGQEGRQGGALLALVQLNLVNEIYRLTVSL